jgi:RNA recognition motif-containing protein
VEFASYKDMKNAITKLDDTEINGRRIRIIEDKSRSRHRYCLISLVEFISSLLNAISWGFLKKMDKMRIDSL